MGALPSEAAYHDALTGLPHRLAFDERLASEAARVRRHGGAVALCLLHLHRLGRDGGARGQRTGDEELRAVAVHLDDLRAGDGAYRTGRDEFALIIVGTDEAGAGLAVERIRCALLADRACRGIGISAGIARITGDTASTLALADAKLHAARSLRR
jgi:diguanylate cyclase (GGDEF)-like protein